MEVIDIDYVYNNEKCVIGLGNFDGFHLGHQSLLNDVKKMAKNLNLKSAALIFKNHTRSVLNLSNIETYLTSYEDKISLLNKLEFDLALTVTFNKFLLELTPENFIKDFLIKKLGVKGIVVGENFRFGYKALGDINTLISFSKKYNYDIIITKAIMKDAEMISSSRIRNSLMLGKVEDITECLGRPYRIYGNVVHGKSRGRNLGFPTANISLIFNYEIPSNGVYITRTTINDKIYYSLTNIGANPTFNENEKKIETYILNLNQEIYGHKIKVEFLKKIRDDVKFASVKQLIDQLHKDKNLLIQYKDNLQFNKM